MNVSEPWDAVIVGAGAAGLFCAGVAGQLGLRVLLIDHSTKIAEKIRISGGGRCNFTNRNMDAATAHRHYVGQNTHFCRSALSRYTPQDFISLVQRHGIAFHEKHKGQLFCDRSSADVIDMLLAECGATQVTRWHGCGVHAVGLSNGVYTLDTANGQVSTHALVVATGGLSVPKIGATDFGYRIARQFDLRLTDTRPGLVPLTFDAAQWASCAQLAGLSLPVSIETGDKKNRTSFDEDLLFTHKGLSGPAVLQISSHWQPGADIRINLAAGVDVAAQLSLAKLSSKKTLPNALAQWVPARLAQTWTQHAPHLQRTMPEVSDKELAQLAQSLTRWSLTPSGSEGYAKAEVTVGGLDTRDMSSQTMESKQQGLYFIGEVLDVTGWLGGYNFQWAWASAFACAHAVAAQKPAPN